MSQEDVYKLRHGLTFINMVKWWEDSDISGFSGWKHWQQKNNKKQKQQKKVQK